MEDDVDGGPSAPESLLPYELWTEEALRQVVVMALGFAAEKGLPGEHHFFISFRTDAPGVSIPPRLLQQYPTEMTIVLQHQFWDLKLEGGGERFSVGLSFGGVPSVLQVPLAAVTGFADPHVQFGLRFRAPEERPANDAAGDRSVPVPVVVAEEEEEAPEAESQVVSLDAFRKRPPGKE